MHAGSIAGFESVDGVGQVLPSTLVLDFLDRVQVRFEREDKSTRFWQPVKCLAFAAQKGL